MKPTWQDENLLQVKNCPLCLASDYADILKRSDGLMVRECLTCGLGYIAPRPNSKALLDYYSKDYFTGGKDFFAGKNYCEERHQAIATKSITGYQEIVDYIEIRGKTVLEIGCATGSLLRCLADLGAKELIGIDIAEYPIQYGIQRYGLDLRTQSLNDPKFPDAYFDVIIMTDVIEHVENLNDFLDELKRVLKPGGVIYAITPNFAPSKVIGKLWICLHRDFEHLQYFSQKSIDYFCKQKGLIVNQCWLNGIPIELKDYPNIMSHKLHYIRYFNVAITNLVKKVYIKLIRNKDEQLRHNINLVISK